MSWLLDTNVISELVAPRPSKAVIQWMAEREDEPDRFFISAFTLGEIRRGILKLDKDSQKFDRLMSWLANEIPRRFHGRVLYFTDETARHWAKMTAAVPKGVHVANMDSLIAAIAREHELTLVTRNIKDVTQFDGVAIENPWGDA